VIKSLTGGGIMLLYDKLIEGNNWRLALYDSGVFGTSILSINVIKDMFLS